MGYLVKPNKCFANAFAAKFIDSESTTVAANDSEYVLFTDDAILATDSAIVTIVRTDSTTIDNITESHVISAEGVMVKVKNSGASSATVTVNCMVL